MPMFAAYWLADDAWRRARGGAPSQHAIRSLQAVEWADHRAGTAIQYVSVDHRCLYVPMPEKLLDGAYVVTVLEKMRGERVTERVTRDPFPDVCTPGRRGDFALDGAFVKMVAAPLTGGAVCVRTGRREQVLPAQVACGGRDLPGEAARQVDPAATDADIADVTYMHSIGLPEERGLECIREDGNPVVATLAASDHDFTALKREILDPDRERFIEARSRALEQIRDEPGEALHLREHGKQFATRQHGWEAARSRWTRHTRWQLDGPPRLPGCRQRGWRSQLAAASRHSRSDMPQDASGKQRSTGRPAHGDVVFVIQDVSTNPAGVRLHCPIAELPRVARAPDLVQQFRQARAFVLVPRGAISGFHGFPGSVPSDASGA